MTSILIIIICAGASILTLLAFLGIVFTVIRRKLKEMVELKFRDQTIVLQSLRATLFSRKARGGGALVLGERILWFLLISPATEFSLPLREIRSVSLTDSHLGKTYRRPLLLVEFSPENGEDAIAWKVKDAGRWKASIEEALNKTR